MSVRLPGEVRSRLEQQARVAHEPPARYAARILDEGLRIAAHPGIVFRSTPTGARLAGLADGPDVVEVIKVVGGLESTGEDRVREAARWLGLPERKIRRALDYYADFPDEVDAELRMREQAEAELAERFDRRRDLLG